jgi:hypothetical protein
MFGQELKNETRDSVVLLVQGEMAVEDVDFGIRKEGSLRTITSAPNLSRFGRLDIGLGSPRRAH